ncbi:MAG TPA: phage tail tape measure protein [Polyangiaceae bacterium]|nr:phage tail tape measure protein [Polyangiaceae bacterium]
MAGRFSIEAVFKATDQMSRVMARIEGNTKSFRRSLSKDFDGLGSRFRKIGDELGDLAKKAATAGVALAGAAGAAAYNIGKTGADFEQAMANVGAVSLMTRDQVKDLEQAALKLAASTKFSATEVAGGMELMGKAGFTNSQILQGIGPILSAAAAEGAEFGEVAGHVSNLLKGMGLETDQAGRVADVLTLASARTNSSISSLGESMANVSATARQFKIPLEQAVASVALLQDVGIDASTAGTAVNTMLTNMANPSKEAQAQMKALGISFQDTHGDMLPLVQVFEQFSKASQKSGGNMKQVAFFSDLVGLRGQKAALNLEKLFAEGKFGDLVKELDGAAGSAQKMADLRMDTLGGDLTKLSNTTDTLKIGLFDMESGPLRGVVQGVTKWVDANKGLITSNIESALTTLSPIVKEVTSAFLEGFTAVMPAVKSFVEFMFNDFGSKTDWVGVLKRAAQIVGGLTVAALGAAAVFGGVLAAGFAEAVALASDVVNGWNWMIDGIGKVLFAVDDFFANLGAKWRAFKFADLAKYLIDGLVNGITGGAQ